MANKGAKKKPLRPDEVVKVPKPKVKVNTVKPVKNKRKQSNKKKGLNWWEKGSDL